MVLSGSSVQGRSKVVRDLVPLLGVLLSSPLEEVGEQTPSGKTIVTS